MKIINGYEKITLHLAPQDQGYDKAMAAFECSLDNLGLPGLGLYLIHWPWNFRAKEGGSSKCSPEGGKLEGIGRTP